MTRLPRALTAIACLALLTACGGGGGGGGLGSSVGSGSGDVFTQYAALAAAPELGTQATEVVVDAMSSTVAYDGVINLNHDGDGYYGPMSVSVNYGTDKFTGSAGNFQRYEVVPPSTAVLTNVSGSISMSGSLTGDNETSVTSGLTGTGSGSVAGDAVSYTIGGHIAGDNAEGVALYLDEVGTLGGGVGIAAR